MNHDESASYNGTQIVISEHLSQHDFYALKHDFFRSSIIFQEEIIHRYEEKSAQEKEAQFQSHC